MSHLLFLRVAGELYTLNCRASEDDMNLLAHNIESGALNTTRFPVLLALEIVIAYPGKLSSHTDQLRIIHGVFFHLLMV